jgi:hypothetical protein
VEKNDIDSRLEDIKKSWEATRCMVKFDGWIDGKGGIILNLLGHCPWGTMFIKFVDALAHVKDETLLCELTDGFVQEISLQHVVQIITYNTTNYGIANKLLIERHPILLWTRCVAYCINLMLEDVGKISFIKEVIDWVRTITKSIYNHAFFLRIMRRFIINRELLHPTITRFAKNFIYLIICSNISLS